MRETTIRYVLILCSSIFLVGFALTPFIWMIVVSLTTEPDFLITGNYTASIQNYINILTIKSLHFLDYLKNSVVVSAATAFAVTIITCLAAFAVSRLRFPGRMIIPIFVLAVSMFPQISIVGYLVRMFSSVGLTNTYWALILPYTAWTAPIALWINMSYFLQIPHDLDKAALVDGASRIKVLFKIILPIALPGIFSSFLLVFIMSFNEFLFALMLTIDYTAQTIPVGIALFQGIHGEIPWGNLMAASAISSVPLVAITLVFQRYIVSGLMSGSVKA